MQSIWLTPSSLFAMQRTILWLKHKCFQKLDDCLNKKLFLPLVSFHHLRVWLIHIQDLIPIRLCVFLPYRLGYDEFIEAGGGYKCESVSTCVSVRVWGLSVWVCVCVCVCVCVRASVTFIRKYLLLGFIIELQTTIHLVSCLITQ